MGDSVTLFTGTALPLRYGFFYSYILTLWFTESPIRLYCGKQVPGSALKKLHSLENCPTTHFFLCLWSGCLRTTWEWIADPQPVALPKTETFILLISSSTFLITRHNNAKVFSTSSIPLSAALLSSFSISLIRILENFLWGSFLAQLQPYYHLMHPKLTWFLDSFTLIISLGLENTLLPQATSQWVLKTPFYHKPPDGSLGLEFSLYHGRWSSRGALQKCVFECQLFHYTVLLYL